MRKLFLLIFVFLAICINAQEVIKTFIQEKEIYQAFASKKELQWAVPVSKYERMMLTWERKENSFAKDGIHSFIGYENGKIRATLSFSEKSISGSVFTDEGEIYLANENDVLVLIKDEYHTECGVEHHHQSDIEKDDLLKTFSLSSQNTQKADIKNTDVLRVYRLAFLIDYSVYNEVHFKSKQKVETFWSNIETFLNELYIRDLGIKFEIIRDEKLIRDSESKRVFPLNSNGKHFENTYFVDYGTRKINELIGVDKYDIGVVLALSSNGGGLAYLNGVYKQSLKGASTVNGPSSTIIAHEIGHLFGGKHTFSNTPRYVGIPSEQTEVGRGYSVMSYGSPRDFFSLSSIHTIRKDLVNTPYYDSEARNFVEGVQTADVNIPLGVKINNQSPIITPNSVKSEYTIPKNTYFQFYINAEDNDGDKLSYLAHQRDVRTYAPGNPPSIASFITTKASETNNIRFQPQFNSIGAMFLGTDVTAKGTFTFWLSARDSKPITEQQITKYALEETKVKIIEGIPFKLTNSFKTNYQGNEKIHLTWNVDKKIFPTDSRVRILLSKDFGQTFEHVLVESTENDGAYEVTLPNIEIGNVQVGNLRPLAGVIKVEVIDGLAYALSQIDPKIGGFSITPDKDAPTPPVAEIQFINPPKDLEVSCRNVPEAPKTLETTGGCSAVNVEFSEQRINGTCSNSYQLRRTWTATDSCGNEKIHTQIITITDNEAPQFIGTLPQNTSIKQGQEIPKQVELQATDNCSANVTITKERTNNLKNGLGTITYKWIATDECGNSTTYTQTITITPANEIVFVNPPSDENVSCGNVPTTLKTLETIGGCSAVNVEFSEQRINGTCSNSYQLRRTWTAIDGCGNKKVHTQTITVTDNEAPQFIGTLPRNINIKQGEKVPEQIELKATDNCSANVTITKEQTNNLKNGVGTITYKWIATDECGNSTTYTQTITITPANEIVFVNPPSDENVSCGNVPTTLKTLETIGGCSAVNVEFSEQRINGTCSNSYQLRRTWTAIDGCGNKKVHTQTITVTDNEAPQFIGTLPRNINIKQGEKVPEQVDIQANDNCSGPVNITKERTENLQNGIGTITYKWIARDECGNERTHTQIITITPADGIVFVSPPKDIEVSCGKVPVAPDALPTTGGCSPVKFTFSEEKIKGRCSNSYQLRRTWTATDSCGNKKIHTQTITVTDNEAPQFIGTLPQNINIKQGEKVPEQIELKATDNCSANVTITKERTNNLKNGVGTITYKWTARDECGNSTTHKQTIMINPNKVIEKGDKKLYPNPIHDIFYLRGFENVLGVEIYNPAGRLLRVIPPQNSYNISDLRVGDYIILVKTKTGTDSFKVIKY